MFGRTLLFMDRPEAWQMADEAQLLRHCAPVFFLPCDGALPETIDNNGSMALIDGGQIRFLVTCCHVWEEFMDYRDRVPTARLATVFANGFGAPILLPDPIDHDSDLDLAVFPAGSADWNLGTKQFYRPERWPIPKAKQGSAIAFVGFAGIGRNMQGTVGDFRYSFFGLSVSSVSDRKMVLGAGHSHRTLMDNNGQRVPPMRMGGMSGSPAYARAGNGLFSLAGFVQMGALSNADIFLTHA